MNNFEEYDLNNDKKALMAYIPSIDSIPIVGKKIEHDKNRIVIYSPEQMRRETRRYLNRGIMQHTHILRNKVFLTDGSGNAFFEGYIANIRQDSVFDRGLIGIFDRGPIGAMQESSEVRIEIIGTT